MRIKSYIGRLPQPKDFADAADMLRRLFSIQFTRLSEEQWLAMAHRSFKDLDGALAPRYDPKLAEALKGVDAERPLPQLWKEFDALVGVPVMAIRGANSDILSAETMAAMQTRRPDLETLEVPDQGHAPLLGEPEVIARIAAFIARC
jgi:pimeloyl-ACP methyl ester carboxylesterase